jgi:hypothetical protein
MLCLNELHRKGYQVVKSISYEDSLNIVSMLGYVIQKQIIQEDKNSYVKLATNQEMNLHTDHPDAKYIMWYCESPADVGGESYVLPISHITNHMNHTDVTNLKDVYLSVPPLYKGTEPRKHKLYDGSKFYYADWLLTDKDVYTKKTIDSLHRFQQLIYKLPIEKIFLNEKDILIIDNDKVLHGRASFQNITRCRKLIRHWISKHS